MIPLAVEEIRRLSQDEGMFDHEIAELLGVSRATVNRTRKAHDIPGVNLDNRRDKENECKRCGKIEMLKRADRRRKYCEVCAKVVKLEKKLRAKGLQ